MHLRRVDECPADALPPLAPHEKCVWFVRHGQSVANTKSEAEKFALVVELRDSWLTPKGEQQARALQEVVKCWKPQVVLSSPLSRALQTSCLAFEKETLPIVAWPVLTEFFSEYPECKGRLKEELENDKKLQSLKRWGDVHLDNAVGEWWNISPDLGRLDSFLSWLRFSPFTKIVVVCHWGFISFLMEHARYAERYLLQLDNCTQVRTVWHPEAAVLRKPGKALPPAVKEYAIWLEPADHTPHCPFLQELSTFTEACRASAVLSRCVFISKRGGRPHITLSSFLPMQFELLQKAGQTLRAEGLKLLSQLSSDVAASGDTPGANGTDGEGGSSGSNGKGSSSSGDAVPAWKLKPEQLSCVVKEERTLYAAVEFMSSELQAICQALAEVPGLSKHAAAFRTGGTFDLTLADGPEGSSLFLRDFAEVLDPAKVPLLCSALGIKRTDELEQQWRQQLSTVRWDLCIMERLEGGEEGVRREPGMVMHLYEI